MSRKRRQRLVQENGPIAVSNGASFPGGADAQPDLYAAWKGQVRVLDDQPAAEPADSAADMLAQLRAVADELSHPAPRFAAPKLLSSTDHHDESDEPAESPEPVSPASSGAPRSFDSIDTAAIQRSIESVTTRLESLLARSHEQLAAGMMKAVAAAGDRNGLVHTSVLHDAESRLEAVQQQLEQANGQLDETRAQLERAREQHNDTVARLVERTAEVAQALAEQDSTRDAEWEGSLQRAIGMLSVLESLDDVIASLRIKPDRRSVARLQHFEREARMMARLVELDEIVAVGCVDPDQHEIVSTVGGKARVGTIVELRQRGYMFRGRILRRAQVVVSARD
jgi:molecular chaperone GrpE (heat shock protein)